MNLGDLVTDHALGMCGIIIGQGWTEERENTFSVDWEWLVLYQDGELLGADTNDLQVIR